MKTSTVIACLVLGILSAALPACGSSDSGGTDPVTECKRASAAICKQFYKCLTPAQLMEVPDQVGTSESDCETKENAMNCTTASTTCPSGKTYQSGNADTCLSAIEGFTCEQFLGIGTATTMTPTACDETCK